MYAGASARVTSEQIGRDLNPLGRGDGQAYVGGALNLGVIRPALPLSTAVSGTGSSVNNPGQVGLNQLEIADNPEGTDPDLSGENPGTDLEPTHKVDTDKFKEMFEVPEMDDETRWLYSIGILGGPQGPFQVLPAPDPFAEDQWKIWALMGFQMMVFRDLLDKFGQGAEMVFTWDGENFNGDVTFVNLNELDYEEDILLPLMMAQIAVGRAAAALNGVLQMYDFKWSSMIRFKPAPASQSLKDYMASQPEQGHGSGHILGGIIGEGGTWEGFGYGGFWQNLWNGVVGAVNAVSDFVNDGLKRIQDGIDSVGRRLIGKDRWNNFRSWCNFENEYLMAGIDIALAIVPVAIPVKIGALVFRVLGIARRVGRVTSTVLKTMRIRRLYMTDSARMLKLNAGLIVRGVSSYRRARLLHSLRNVLKVQYRSMMNPRARHALYKSDPIRPFSFYEKKYYDQGYRGNALYNKIADKSCCPNEKFNRMWAWYNFFRRWWDEWRRK